MSKMSSLENGLHLTKNGMTTLVNNSIDGSKMVTKGPPWWRSQRYILAYFLFGGIMNVFFQRINFSIAILCMVNHTALNLMTHRHFDTNSNQSLNSTVTSTLNPFQGLTFYLTNNKMVLDNFTQFVEYNQIMSLEEGGLEDSTSVPGNKVSLAETTSGSDSDGINCPNSSSRTSGSTGDDEAYIESHVVMQDGPLLWDKQLQGILLGAVYWSYLCVQIPANLVVRKIKKKTIVVWSMTVMSLMTMLMHLAALWSPWAVFAVKLVQGACTALVIIAMYSMLGKWAPPKERGRLITLAMAGQNLGNIIVFPMSGILCKYSFLGGWPSIFYIFGGVGFVWIILFFFFTDESPSTHRYITEEEKHYITSSLTHNSLTRHSKVPWSSIVTSPPFWAIVIGQFSFTWGLLLILSTLPQYMLEVLKFDIKSNGVFTMLPYIALLLTTLAAGSTSDSIIRNKIMSVLWTRRTCVLIANLVPAVLLAGMSFLDSSQAALAISLLVIAVGASGLALSGFMVSPYDIAPQFATEMMIIINTVATAPGILASYIVAAVTKDQTREQWQIVFFLTSGIYLLGALCFCVLGQAVIQPWAIQERSIVIQLNAKNAKDSKVQKMIDKEKELMLNEC